VVSAGFIVCAGATGAKPRPGVTLAAVGETMLGVALDGDGAFRSGRVASVRLVEAGRPVPDPSAAGARLIRRLSREDLGKGAVRIGRKGRILGRVGE
jgi:hypothetical protein